MVSDLRSETKGSRFETGYLAMCRGELPGVIVGLMFNCL